MDAALTCVTRHGVSKTTVDDVAREAGVSRATVYRVFPGGKDAVLGAAAETEVARLFSALGVVMGEAEGLADVLVDGMVAASAAIFDHAALQTLIDREPEVILRHLAFDECDRMLQMASQFVAPFLTRWMDGEEAARVGEWAARIVISYAMDPSDAVDLTRPADTRSIVERFMLPGIRALRAADPDAPVDLGRADRGASITVRRTDHRPPTAARREGEVS